MIGTKWFFVFCLFLFLTSAYAQSSQLTIHIKGIEKVKGEIRVCLIQDSNDFPDICKYGQSKEITGKEIKVTFDNLLHGKYVATLYQDVNNNGKLDKNFLGIPKEKYGFSNDPGSKFGLPDFKECLFEVKENKEIVIEL